jgi:pilus assembly protein Flp/PilA
MKKTITRFIKRLSSDEKGATAIEYGLIAALIAVVIIGAVSLVGSDLGNTFNNVANQL